jgi:hypothetical protein
MCTDMSKLTIIDKTGAQGGERPESIVIPMPRGGEKLGCGYRKKKTTTPNRAKQTLQEMAGNILGAEM